MLAAYGHVAVALNRLYKAAEDTEKSRFGRVEGNDALDDGGQDDGRAVGFRLRFGTARLIVNSHLRPSSGSTIQGQRTGREPRSIAYLRRGMAIVNTQYQRELRCRCSFTCCDRVAVALKKAYTIYEDIKKSNRGKRRVG